MAPQLLEQPLGELRHGEPTGGTVLAQRRHHPVAVGADANGVSVMQGIATWGHGRFYQSNSIQDVPQIFLKETNEATDRAEAALRA